MVWNIFHWCHDNSNFIFYVKVLIRHYHDKLNITPIKMIVGSSLFTFSLTTSCSSSSHKTSTPTITPLLNSGTRHSSPPDTSGRSGKKKTKGSYFVPAADFAHAGEGIFLKQHQLHYFLCVLPSLLINYSLIIRFAYLNLLQKHTRLNGA